MAGPLLISIEHRGTIDGKPLHEFFTNVFSQADRFGYLDESGIEGHLRGKQQKIVRVLWVVRP